VNKFEKERDSLECVKVGNMHKKNNRLLSKDASVYFFIKNSKECAVSYKDSKHDKGFIPGNLKEIANELFSMDKVYVAQAPCEDYFSKEGKWIDVLPASVFRSLDSHAIIESVKEYLKKGAVVYLYTYYGLVQNVCEGNNKANEYIFKKRRTYWWRMIVKKEK
jgi:hypothetical protein